MSKVVDLLGYKYAKSAMKQDEHTFDALKYLFAKQMQKNTTVIEWTSVNDRLPESASRKWFVVLIDNLGSFRTIGSSQFVYGEWLHVREGFVSVTHWAEMPEELP
jgi:hypothetical protein